MKKLLLILVVSFIATSVSMAQIIAVESFDYQDLIGDGIDGIADGGEGWAGPWEVFEGDPFAFTIEDEGYLPDGIEFPTKGFRLKGECLGTGQRAYRPLETPIEDDGSDIWFSFVLESESAIGASWQGVSLWSPGGEGEQSLFGKNWGPMVYGQVFRGTGADSSIPVEDNVPVWIVVKIELSGDASSEQAFLWVNPDPTTEPMTDIADATVEGALNNGATHIACHFGNTAGIIVYFDELRVAKSFEDVVAKGENSIKNKLTASSISTCYPNPFNASTTIEFNLNSRESVSLDIYNAVGRKIKTLVDGEQSSGNYKIEWNAVNQYSGVYFYKLTVGNYTEVNKIILK